MSSKNDVRSLKGSIPAIVTPMHTNGDLDLQALRDLVEWHIAEGTNGIVVMGTTGESPTLDSKEWEETVTTVVTQVGGRIPVIAGTGSNCTRSSVQKSVRACELGVDGLLVVTPYYNKPTQEGLYMHFRAISQATHTHTHVGIILYNVPGRTGCDLLPETVARLSQLPNIVATKEASGKFERYAEIKAKCKPGFTVYTGDDAHACQGILSGACSGVISVTANVCPKIMSQMAAAALRGDTVEAQRLDSLVSKLHQSLFCEPNPTPAKFVLERMGKIPGGLRLPLIPLSEEKHAEVLEAYTHTGHTLPAHTAAL